MGNISIEIERIRKLGAIFREKVEKNSFRVNNFFLEEKRRQFLGNIVREKENINTT